MAAALPSFHIGRVHRRDALAHRLADREVRYLRGRPDPVLTTAQRITRAVTTRGLSAGWKCPPPIVSRVFQELSNGLLAYNNAMKMKQVPVPFAYVQFNALLLNSFNILCPIAVARFTENIVMSGLTAALITGGFTALWLVANELEDPFGTDHNDLPVLQYHTEFCGGVRSLLVFLEEDTWTTGAGPWAPSTEPSNEPTTAPTAPVTAGGVAAAPPKSRSPSPNHVSPPRASCQAQGGRGVHNHADMPAGPGNISAPAVLSGTSAETATGNRPARRNHDGPSGPPSTEQQSPWPWA